MRRLMHVIIVALTMMLFVIGAKGQEPCPVDDGPCEGRIPRWIEHGNIRFRDERAVLDHLAAQARNAPQQVIYFLIYAGEKSCVNEARLRGLRAKSYLVRKHAIAADRIVWKDGGFRPDVSVQIWLLPLGQPGPEPSLSLTLDRSRFRPPKNCQKIKPLKW